MELVIVVLAWVAVAYLIFSKPSRQIEFDADYDRKYGHTDEILRIVNSVDLREVLVPRDAGFLPSKTKLGSKKTS